MRTFSVHLSSSISAELFPHAGLAHKDELDSAVCWLIRQRCEGLTDYTSNNKMRL